MAKMNKWGAVGVTFQAASSSFFCGNNYDYNHHKLRSQDITPVTLVCTNFIIAWCQPRYGSKIETKSQAKVINMLAI